MQGVRGLWQRLMPALHCGETVAWQRRVVMVAAVVEAAEKVGRGTCKRGEGVAKKKLSL